MLHIAYTLLTGARCTLLANFYVTLSYKYVMLEMGFEPMHTICIKPQPRCSPTELLKLSIKSSDLIIFDLQNYIENVTSNFRF